MNGDEREHEYEHEREREHEKEMSLSASVRICNQGGFVAVNQLFYSFLYRFR